MTINQAYQQLVLQLQTLYENREAASIANLVIEHITGFGGSARMVNKNLLLSIAQQQKTQHYTNLLLTNMPLQYVLNEAWFYGLKFYVNESVLIPRPETEELVKLVIDSTKKNNRYTSDDKQYSILDIGTGSGCIAVSLQHFLPLANVTALDVSAAALAVAKKNAEALQTPVTFYELNILNTTEWSRLPMFNCIASNPPYITQKEAAEMHNNVLDHEPHLALFVPDNEPLKFYEAIATLGLQHLHNNGFLYFEINEAYGKQVCEMLIEKKYENVQLIQDMQGKDRMVSAQFIL